MRTHTREARARARNYKLWHEVASMLLLTKQTSNINFLSRSARWLRRL